MITNAFLAVFMPNLESIVFSVVLSIISIGALLVVLSLTTFGSRLILSLISGDSPPRGYQYMEYEKGKPVYRTWTKKDQYLHNRSKRL